MFTTSKIFEYNVPKTFNLLFLTKQQFSAQMKKSDTQIEANFDLKLFSQWILIHGFFCLEEGHVTMHNFLMRDYEMRRNLAMLI